MVWFEPCRVLILLGQRAADIPAALVFCIRLGRFLMKTTTVEEVNEPIDVMTIFRDGSMRPVKFKRGAKAYKISKVTYEWVTKEGNYPINHFAVMADGDDVYEIHLSTLTMSWTLAKVHLK